MPVGARAVHWPDLIVVLLGGRLAAFEVELTVKPALCAVPIFRPWGLSVPAFAELADPSWWPWIADRG